MSISTIRRWIATFKDGEEEIKDKARSGRPREAVTSEKIARVEDLVSNDPYISTIELANKIGISRERISYILHNELSLQKKREQLFVTSCFITTMTHHLRQRS